MGPHYAGFTGGVLPVRYQFKSLNVLVPPYFSGFSDWTSSSFVSPVAQPEIVVHPEVKLKCRGDLTFSVAAPRLWNLLDLVESSILLASLKNISNCTKCDGTVIGWPWMTTYLHFVVHSFQFTFIKHYTTVKRRSCEIYFHTQVKWSKTVLYSFKRWHKG